MRKFPKFSIISNNPRMSKSKIRPVKEGINFKPRGLWYSRDDEWFRWTEEEMFYEPEELEKLYLYSIKFVDNAFINSRNVCYSCLEERNLNTHKILVVSSMKEYREFYYYFKTGNGLIDWRQVQKYFSGFQVDFDPKKYKLQEKDQNMMITIAVYDVRSGSIWDPRVIDRIENLGLLVEYS